MQQTDQIVISASRRTDIPAFYMDWFMNRVEKGVFETINPYNQRKRTIPVDPERVHTIVFWSKNFGPFLQGDFGKTLSRLGFHLFFNFTVNSVSPLLEPRLPSLEDRLNQMEDLCRQFGGNCINWRFDPVCFFKQNGEARVRNNLDDFFRIAEKATQIGIQRCVTSFMDHYPKIRKRTATLPGFSFLDPGIEQKKEVLLSMAKTLNDKHIRLFTCCEKAVLASLPRGSGILKSSCIPNDLLVNMFGGNLSLQRDTGQRIRDGCGCMVSVDIGSYRLHPCYHNCLFCYANPVSKEPEK